MPPAAEPPRSDEARIARKTLVVAGIVIALVAGLVILWTAADAFFLIFAGLLLAAVFCGIGKAFQQLGLGRRLALLLTYLILILAIGGALAWGGITLVQEFNALMKLVGRQLDALAVMLEGWGLPTGKTAGSGDLARFLPNASGLFSSASATAFSILGGIGNAVIVLFIAVFVSWQPQLYRRGLVSLFPRRRRRRIDETVEMGAHELMLWLAGQAISMSVVFLVSWAGLWAISMPNAFVLALQAGLLAFVPTLGPFIAGMVIVLAGLATSAEMALYGLGVYLLIQGVESNVSQPIAQRWTSALPPALTLSAQLVFGLLFGVVGVAMAVPVLAVAMIFVQQLYIEDALGGPVEPEEDRNWV